MTKIFDFERNETFVVLYFCMFQFSETLTLIFVLNAFDEFEVLSRIRLFGGVAGSFLLAVRVLSSEDISVKY